MATLTTYPPALEQQFRTLSAEWREATRFASGSADATSHPAYRAIIDLGTSVVPLILAELAKSPDPWFAALRELTGANPVPPQDRGRPQAAADHWLAWGRTNRLV